MLPGIVSDEAFGWLVEIQFPMLVQEARVVWQVDLLALPLESWHEGREPKPGA